MNKDAFLRFVTNSRDCAQLQLDTAINRWLFRAKNDRLDLKKIFLLAAACVFTFVMCISVILIPLEEASEMYYQNRHKAMPGSAEVLDGYINDITSNFNRFIGEE